MVNSKDTWIYQIDRRSWRQVLSEESPEPRCHQPIAYSPDHGVALLCGGWRNDDRGDRIYSDTWLFRAQEERWERKHPTGDPPGEVSDSVVVYHPKDRRFVLIDSARHVRLYDPIEDRWEALYSAP